MPHLWLAGKTIMLFVGLLALGACTVPFGEITEPEPGSLSGAS